MTAIVYIIISLIIFCLGTIFLAWVLWLLYSKKLKSVLNLLYKNAEQGVKLQEDIDSLKKEVTVVTEDVLTELPCWEIFENELKNNIDEDTRNNLLLALLVIEIQGIPLGANHILYEVAQKLKRSIRSIDTISRYRGEVFVVCLRHLTRSDTAALIVQHIIQVFASPILVNEELITLIVNIGVAYSPRDGRTVADCLLAAHHALDAAKLKGIANYEFYKPQMLEAKRRESLIVDSISTGNIYPCLAISYQPIVNVSSGEIECMDASLAWRNEEFGIIEGDEVLDYAEKQQKRNLIALEWLKLTCQQFVCWHAYGFKPLLLGVTLPVSLLQNTAFICKLVPVMQAAEFNPHWMLIQIRSDAKLVYEELEKSLNMLHYLGVKIGLEERGANSLSVVQLKKFMVNYIKLNKNVTNEFINNSAHTEMLIKASIELAKSLNIKQIVQGVDKPEDVKLLKEAGYDLMVGDALYTYLSSEVVQNEIALDK